MKHLFKPVILLLLVFQTNTIFSQEGNPEKLSSISTFNMFRESSYITALGGIGNMEPLMFEGDIVPYYMLSTNKNNRWGIELSPRIILRMYNQYSYPVRTPSFMPRATFFYHVIDNKDQKRDCFTFLSWCHHSNGQDGNFYTKDSSAINTLTGSFATNFIEGGIFLSRPDKRKPFIINYWKLSAAYHYKQDSELQGLYGRTRFFADYQSSVNLSQVLQVLGNSSRKHNAELSQALHLGWIAGNLTDISALDKKRFIFRYTLSYKPTFLNDVTLFAQYYYGQDYYNIYFNRTLKVLRFGIAAKTSLFN